MPHEPVADYADDELSQRKSGGQDHGKHGASVRAGAGVHNSASRGGRGVHRRRHGVPGDVLRRRTRVGLRRVGRAVGVRARGHMLLCVFRNKAARFARAASAAAARTKFDIMRVWARRKKQDTRSRGCDFSHFRSGTKKPGWRVLFVSCHSNMLVRCCGRVLTSPRAMGARGGTKNNEQRLKVLHASPTMRAS